MKTPKTPKTEANKILDTFDGLDGISDWATVKQCALITVDIIIKASINPIDIIFYWEEIKKEIEKL